MRTATPISTCWRIRLRSMSSATSLPISTPRFIGPGCMISASGLATLQLVVVEPEEMEVFARRRHERAVHALALQPQHHHDVDPGEALLPCRGTPRRRAARSPPAAACAAPRPGPARPSMLRSAMFERATRLCRTSPQIATVSPSSRPLRRRIVSASSSAWVGCSWLPSPALMTAQSTFSDSSCTAPEFGMAHDQHVGVHRVQGHRGVDQRLALDHRADRHRHVDHIGAEPLAGDLERGAGAGRVLEKAVDERAAAQQSPAFLGLAVQFDIAVGKIEKPVDLRRRQPLDAEQVPVPERGGVNGPLHARGSIGAARWAARLAERRSPASCRRRRRAASDARTAPLAS